MTSDVSVGGRGEGGGGPHPGSRGHNERLVAQALSGSRGQRLLLHVSSHDACAQEQFNACTGTRRKRQNPYLHLKWFKALTMVLIPFRSLPLPSSPHACVKRR